MYAHEYRVTFGYLATTTLNGQRYTHRGQDRSCPVGTKIKIGDTIIGETGNTGLTTGPHLHIQAGTDAATQNTVHPGSHSFKPGTVTAIRTSDEKQWGKFITIKNESGTYVTYAHLSKVNVKVGQVIKQESKNMTTRKEVHRLVRAHFGRSASKTELDRWVGKITTLELLNQLEGGKPYQARINRAKDGKLIAQHHLMPALRRAYVESGTKALDKLTEELKQANVKLNQKQAQLEPLQREIKDLNREINDDVEAWTKERKELEGKIERLQTQIKAEKGELKGWQLIREGIRQLLGIT